MTNPPVGLGRTPLRVTPLEQVESHHSLDVNVVGDAIDFAPSDYPGATKFRGKLGRGIGLDAMLVNKESDVLLVALHGATNRKKMQLPRFEYFRTLRGTPYSSMYFSDPALELSPRLELAWFTGWLELDLYPLISEWARRAAAAIGATHIIFLGSSGGGFAALQASTYLPRSLALPFSPQTSIDNYLVQGVRLGAQRAYMRDVMPQLIPEDGLESLQPNQHYFEVLGERASTLLRYSRPQRNLVHYVQNINDPSHIEQHYLPFKETIEASANQSRVEFELQDDLPGHHPPTKEKMLSALEAAVSRIRAVGAS